MDDIPSLVSTRLGLHALAEHVLCPFRYARAGKIGLTVMGGGFATPPVPDQGSDSSAFVAVVGDRLQLSRIGEATREWPITTLREAADAVGGPLGAPTDVFQPSTDLDPDRPLGVNGPEAGRLAVWFDDCHTALSGLRAGSDGADAQAEITLWPEHFDVALTLDEVNYGGSPGDQDQDEPYAYVGPWAEERRTDPFFNAAFGATRSWQQLSGAAEVLAFFEQGRDVLR